MVLTDQPYQWLSARQGISFADAMEMPQSCNQHDLDLFSLMSSLMNSVQGPQTEAQMSVTVSVLDEVLQVAAMHPYVSFLLTSLGLQSSWGQCGAYLVPTGPRQTPYKPHGLQFS